MSWWPQREPQILLGTTGPFYWRRPFAFNYADLMNHGHIIGASGSGKSYLLAQLCVELLTHGFPIVLIDPHGSLARLVLTLLVDAGVYTRPEAFDRIIYADFGAAEARERFMPFNVLAQAGHSDNVATNAKEAFHRAFPELGTVAATFDTLLPDAVELLYHRGLHLTELQRVLTDAPFRAQLLAQESDRFLLASFRDTYETLKKSEQVSYAGSVLRRARQLTRTRILKYGLGQDTMALDFGRILEHRQAVLINLAVENSDAMRLLGSLLAVSLEQAVKARKLLPDGSPYSSIHFIIDEFQLFTTPDANDFTAMLSETRKFKGFLWTSHQDWSQISPRLRGAVQNAGIEITFGLEHDDAEYSARKIGRIDLERVKHIVADEQAEQRSHPVYTSAADQWIEWVQNIKDLAVSEAYVSVKRRDLPSLFRPRRVTHQVHRIQTLPLKPPALDVALLREVEDEYLRRYFTPRSEVEHTLAAVHSPESPLPRKEVLDQG